VQPLTGVALGAFVSVPDTYVGCALPPLTGPDPKIHPLSTRKSKVICPAVGIVNVEVKEPSNDCSDPEPACKPLPWTGTVQQPPSVFSVTSVNGTVILVTPVLLVQNALEELSKLTNSNDCENDGVASCEVSKAPLLPGFG